MPRKMIIASHGTMAKGIYDAAKMIVGDCPNVDTYNLADYDGPQNILEKVRSSIVDDQTDYVVFCDIKGGSVHTQMMQLMNHKNVYIVTGMTLSMIVEFILSSEEKETLGLLKEIVQSSKDHTQIYDHDSVYEMIKNEKESNELW